MFSVKCHNFYYFTDDKFVLFVTDIRLGHNIYERNKDSIKLRY